MAEFITRSARETEALGRRLGQALAPGTVVAFTGPLGAGKTTFCRGIAAGLGCTDPVQSPTFTIANLYRGPVPLAHFDAWRISTEEDLATAGFYDYLDAGAVAAVEWSEHVTEFLGPAPVRVAMELLPDDGRRITIEGAQGFE